MAEEDAFAMLLGLFAPVSLRLRPPVLLSSVLAFSQRAVPRSSARAAQWSPLLRGPTEALGPEVWLQKSALQPC